MPPPVLNGTLNDTLGLELTAEGNLIVMSPAGGEISDQEAEITFHLRGWTKRDGTGKSFSSSAGFTLLNGATRSPDASWVARSRWEALKRDQRQKYPPLCPDFVIALRSPSDRLHVLQLKMQEWIENGARLGWLIDPDAKRVYVYRPDAPVQQLNDPETVSGEPVLPGFTLDLREVW